MMAMMFWMILFWAVLLAGGFALLGGQFRRPGRSGALRSLEYRLAQGEIDVAEFERRRDALAQSGGSTSAGRWLAMVVAGLVALFVVVPVIAMAANGWDMDMWDMHSRGSDTAGSALVRGGLQADVIIEDFAFSPGNLEVPVGATVTWTNEDSAPHDATARNGDWRTERLSEGESDSLTFDTAGVFDYYCSIHSSMKARLTVR
jgi:plastocyanin